MAFVKLDTGILRSTIWFDKEARDVFITALLMAEPMEIEQPMEQIAVRSLEGTGWSVPPGWYGFVPAAGIGILSMAGVSEDVGYLALERLGSPEPDSRSQDFEGRRLVRIDGGYLVLNFMRYREKDHTAAMRMRRLRARKRDAVTSPSDAVTGRTVTEGREQRTEAYPLATIPVGREVVAPPRYEQPPRLPSDRAEQALTDEIRRLQRELGTRIARLSEHPKSQDMVPAWTRRVTAYDRKDKTKVAGVADYRTLTSIDRLEKSIADADWWLEKLDKEAGLGA